MLSNTLPVSRQLQEAVQVPLLHLAAGAPSTAAAGAASSARAAGDARTRPAGDTHRDAGGTVLLLFGV